MLHFCLRSYVASCHQSACPAACAQRSESERATPCGAQLPQVRLRLSEVWVPNRIVIYETPQSHNKHDAAPQAFIGTRTASLSLCQVTDHTQNHVRGLSSGYDNTLYPEDRACHPDAVPDLRTQHVTHGRPLPMDPGSTQQSGNGTSRHQQPECVYTTTAYHARVVVNSAIATDTLQAPPAQQALNPITPCPLLIQQARGPMAGAAARSQGSARMMFGQEMLSWCD